ncbi:MAG: hypothetical protein KGO96_12370 [Elusimicrobia bacterium]|nr:hypothetical protein [Elusimicrobiota bacterium]MDE2426691.1 hypothetical protein [Elusimicrobiota bacterium]
MPIELKIIAGDTHEFDCLLRRFMPGHVAQDLRVPQTLAEEPEAEEPAAPLAEAPKRTRRTKAEMEAARAAEADETRDSAATAEAPATAAAAAESPSEEHPMLVGKTLADIKELGGKLVASIGAQAVTSVLQEKFGVRAFGQLAAEDYDRAFAALEMLK